MADKESEKNNNPLVKLCLWAFSHAKTTFIIWLVLLIGGVGSYLAWLDREGFPPIQVPIAVANGTYFVNDPDKVDEDVTEPLSKALSNEDRIQDFETTANNNFYTVVVFFEEGIESQRTDDILKNAIEDAEVLPDQATINYQSIDPGKYLNEYEILLSFYSEDSTTSLEELESKAQDAAKVLENSEVVESAEVKSQFSEGVNPVTGEASTVQSSFGSAGFKNNGSLEFYKAVTIGVKGNSSYDVIDLSNATEEAVAKLNTNQDFDNYGVEVTADFGPSIETQISSLQENLLTGLVAVAVISLLLITWRASIITALFMVSVMLATLLVLYLIGYTLNTISLFALVLALGLFVDDATVIVEAIDASRQKRKKSKEVVKAAIRKVAAASFAGTMTTVLVFLPLVFVGGILGEFIKILPVTIIIALLTSLFLSLTLIPFLSKFILLGKNSGDFSTPVTKLEEWLSEQLAKLPLIARKSQKKAAVVFIALLLLPVVMFGASGYYASQIKFNIFPPSKDADQLQMQISFAPGTTIDKAEDISNEINKIVKEEIEDQIVEVAYFDTNERSAMVFIQLIPFTDRDIKSPELVDELEGAFEDFARARVRVNQVDGGPPSEEFPFKTQIYSDDLEEASRLAQDIESFLEGRQIERNNGTEASVVSTNIAHTQDVSRKSGERYIEVQAGYNADDTTALVESTKKAVREEFDNSRLGQFGLSEDDIEFDFGQESENQESFSSLGVVGPIALVAMFILLALQFRSFIQPLLIFMAIPFSFFGVMYGLYITDNPISFFVMVGFFGLIGIAVNNTILLTDYANQERRAGKRLIESISSATEKRFRPLLATSLTTVAALLPLALTDPFWEALAFTIIFGLLSSTLLVIVSFPYYYLAAEMLRNKTKLLFQKIFSK